MDSNEIRKKFLDFFAARGHTVVPSSSLIPNDPSVLLTTAGMQQFVPYFTGAADPKKDFGSRRTVSIQKSFRTVDIDEVGDETHLTFFEMLGHFSFGDYFKKETIQWTYEFATNILGISSERISATIFAGDDKVPFDQESYDTWKRFLPEARIKRGPREDNVWGPVGAEGICGAANEIYVDGTEVATLVFPEYFCDMNKNLTPLPEKGVDVGWGFERVIRVAQHKKNIFETDLFAPLIELLPQEVEMRHKRIMVDHLRGTAFLLADGVRPSNKERGYILRRLMRRAFVYEHLYKIPQHVFDAIIHDVVHEYGEFYPELLRENQTIREEYRKERERFAHTLIHGLKELEREEGVITPARAFRLYETFGLPFEIIKELGSEKAYTLTRGSFDEEFKKHQEISRAGQEKKFGGHGLLLDTGELKAADEQELKMVTRLHTATHLLNAALHKVLGDTVVQNGSDITAERTRFDFNFPKKLTEEEIKKIEELVNYAIEKDFPVTIEILPVEQAKKTGAFYMERSKYPDPVTVYTVGNETEIFSQELCGGPHVTHTSEIGKFKIVKEESSSAGIRRIRGVIE